MTKDSLVKVFHTQGIFEAEVVKSKLEANGIPALLKYEAIGQIIGITVDGLGRVEVFVAPEHAQEALRLIEETDEEADAPGDFEESAGLSPEGLPTSDDATADKQE